MATTGLATRIFFALLDTAEELLAQQREKRAREREATEAMARATAKLSDAAERFQRYLDSLGGGKGGE